MKYLLLVTALISIAPVRTASAQDRYYVWTYPDGTEPSGESQIESNSFLFTPSVRDRGRPLLQQFELEYGVTDNFQLGLYQVFGQLLPAGDFSPKSFMVEALYSLDKRKLLTVDAMLYFEYERDWNLRNPNHFEIKLITSHDYGSLTATLNGILEHEFGGRTSLAPEFTAGLSYELVPEFRAGAEALAAAEDDDKSSGDDMIGTSPGPTLSFLTPYFGITSGVTFGLTQESNAVSYCTTIGIDL